jgi:hypothetical protein
MKRRKSKKLKGGMFSEKNKRPRPLPPPPKKRNRINAVNNVINSSNVKTRHSNGTLRNGTLRNGTVQNGTVQHGTLQHGTLQNGLKVVTNVKRSKKNVIDKLRTAKKKVNSASHNIGNVLGVLQSNRFAIFQKPQQHPVKNQMPQFNHTSEIGQLLSDFKDKTIEAFNKMRKMDNGNTNKSKKLKKASYYFTLMKLKAEELLKNIYQPNGSESTQFNEYIEKIQGDLEKAAKTIEESNKSQKFVDLDLIQEMAKLIENIRKKKPFD